MAIHGRSFPIRAHTGNRFAAQAFAEAAIPRLYANPVTKGPPVPGAPWTSQFVVDMGAPPPQPAALTPVDVVLYAPPVTRGPPIAGAPWTVGFRVEMPTANPATGVEGVGRPAGKPYLERVISPDNRASRASEKLSAIINSLMMQGYIVQVDVTKSSYAIRGGALVKTRAPTASDDLSAPGVFVGVPWLDTTANKIYFCLRADLGNAAWIGPLG